MDQLSQFSDLSIGEKLQLVECLWDQIGASPESLPIADWQKEELDKRKQTYEANPGSGIAWEDAQERIRRGDEK
jgi:putative addiction module component (TIGR02574 family)